MFEEYIHGREITVTIIDKECFPPIEIITKNEFYDYDAKYHSNETLLIEAKLNNRELTEINKIAFKSESKKLPKIYNLPNKKHF